MPLVLDPALVWWISVVEIPAAAALVVWLLRGQRSLSNGLAKQRSDLDTALRDTASEIARFRLEVVRGYATQSALRECEQRLAHQLLRMERKLDDLLVGRLP